MKIIQCKILNYLFIFIFFFNSSFIPALAIPSIISNVHKSPKLIRKYSGINEYLLSNGMKVILKQNHNLPLATFSIWYRVGSRNEHDGIRGIAHFLEHMMFKGTKKLKATEVSTTIQNCGGVFNAFTFSDGTAYYETIPPKYLPTIIQLEADRMQNSTLLQKELDLERNVVLSELEGGQNNPGTVLNEKVKNISYDLSPYKHPVIGYREDINMINSSIMKEFYKKYYIPNNAFIVVVGDFDENKVLSLIDSAFGFMKPNLTLDISVPHDKPQTQQRRARVVKNGTFKILEISYHIPEVNHDDIFALSILDELLFRGKKSPLRKRLIDSGLATDVSGGCDFTLDPGMFSLVVSLTPKASHKKVESIINYEISRFLKYGPSLEDLQAAKNRSKALYSYSLDGSYSDAVNLGFYEIVRDWTLSVDVLDRLNELTPEKIKTVCKKYFNKENSSVGEFIPVLRPGEKYEAGSVSLNSNQHYKSGGTVAPVLLHPVNKVSYKKIYLKNKSVLIYYSDIDLPITYISGLIPGGTSVLPKNKELAGEIISRLFLYGSKKFSKSDIETFLDNTGTSIEFSVDEEGLKFDLVTLNENLLSSVELLTDIVLNPVFTKHDLNIEKNKIIAELIQSKDDNRDIARRKITQILYPISHPYYKTTVDNDIKNAKQLSLTDLKSLHKKLVNTQVVLSLASNVNPTIYSRLLELFNNGIAFDCAKPFVEVDLPVIKSLFPPKFENIFVSGKQQSDVYLTHLNLVNRIHPDFYKLHLANYILGGSLLINRLALNVRDKAGLVYTINSYLSGTFGIGEFNIYFGSNNANVDKSLAIIRTTLNEYLKNGVTPSELAQAKRALIDSYGSKYLSSYKSICNSLLSIERYKLGENYISDYPKIINSISVKDVNYAIRNYIKPENLNIVVAGEYVKK